MIRWHFIFTRVIVVVIILALIRWGLGPVANYVTVRGIETATGARAEIASTTVGLFPPRVQYSDVRIADPRSGKNMEDIFRADSIDLVIDGDALLKRRFVARDGRITGITIGADRDSDGHLESLPSDDATNGPSLLDGLVGSLSDKAEGTAVTFVDELETVRRGRAIQKRWEEDYAALLARGESLEQQIRDIRDEARTFGNGDELFNKLRDTAELPRLLERAMQIREELVSVRQQIDSMPGRVQTDLASMQQAKQMDLEKVDAYIPGNLSDSKNLGLDLIANAISGEVKRVRDYLEGSRAIADYTIVAPDTERTRGKNFDLLGQDAPPETLIRRCEISGMMRASGKLYAMKGVMENITPTPERLEEPTKATFQLDGPDQVNVEVVRDRRDGNNVDWLTIHWPDMNPKPIRMGQAEDVQLAIDGGNRELWIRLKQEDGQLQGRLVSKQVGVHVSLTVDPSVSNTAMVRSLQDSLADVDRVEVDSRFEGTWDSLDFDVQSNLSQMFSRATREAVADQIAESKRQLAAKVHSEHLEQTQALNQWLSSHQGEANELMRRADESIAEITNKIADKTDRFADNIWNAIEGKLR